MGKAARNNLKQKNRSALSLAATEVLVQNFKDYREFLGELYQRVKSHSQNYSYLKFAQDLGFSPTNVIRLTIAGKRDLADKSARRITRSLGLKEVDRLYFLELVRHQASRSQERRKSSARELVHLQHSMIADESTKASIEYFSRWYHPVVREFIKREDGVRSADEIVGRIFPKISVAEAQDAIDVLLRLKYIRFDASQACYRVNDEAATIVPAQAIANHFAAIQFHREMLSVADQAIDQLSESQREINAMSLILSDENFELLRYRIRDFCQKALELERSSQSRGHIVQFNAQLINLSPSTCKNSDQKPAFAVRKDKI